jgi:hypothetical protein
VRRLTLATSGPITAGSVFRGSHQGLSLRCRNKPTHVVSRANRAEAAMSMGPAQLRAFTGTSAVAPPDHWQTAAGSR